MTANGIILYSDFANEKYFCHWLIGDNNVVFPSMFDDELFKVEVTENEEGIKENILKHLLNIDIIKNNIEKGLLDKQQIKLLPLGTLKGGVHFKKMIKDIRKVNMVLD